MLALTQVILVQDWAFLILDIVREVDATEGLCGDDAQCIVRLLVKERHLIAGGGATKMEVSLCLRELMVETTGMGSNCFRAYVNSLEVIPYTLAKNAG